jgi:hypothetical protein
MRLTCRRLRRLLWKDSGYRIYFCAYWQQLVLFSGWHAAGLQGHGMIQPDHNMESEVA